MIITNDLYKTCETNTIPLVHQRVLNSYDDLKILKDQCNKGFKRLLKHIKQWQSTLD